LSLEGAALEGNRSARIALIEYSDFQCPFCGNFARETLPSFRERYVKSGKVLLAFRHLPLAEMHPLATRAAETAVCAEREGKFWDLHDRFFSQKRLDEAHLLNMANAVGLEPSSLSQCVRDQAVARVNADVESGKKLGITGTPTFLIGTVQSDGRVKVSDILVGMQTTQQLDAAVSNLEATAKGRD
jgi:protein-disulfide isomerase